MRRGGIVAALAFGFASNFLLFFQEGETDAAFLSVRIGFEALALVAAAVWACRAETSLRALVGFMAFGFVCELAIGLADGERSFFAAMLHGAMKGLSITTTGAVLFLLPSKTLKSDTVLGFAFAVLLGTFVRFVPGLPPEFARAVLMVGYLACLGLVMRYVDARSRRFARVGADGISSAKGLLHGARRERKSAFLMAAIAAVLSPLLGAMQGSAALQHAAPALSDAGMALLFVLVFVVYVTSLVSSSDAWFNRLFSVLMLASTVSLLALSMVPEIFPAISGCFGAITVVSMIPVCVFSIGFAQRHGISPLFICATLPAVISIAFDLGYETSLVLDSFVTTDGDMSKLASIALAVIAGAALFIAMAATSGASDDGGAAGGKLPASVRIKAETTASGAESGSFDRREGAAGAARRLAPAASHEEESGPKGERAEEGDDPLLRSLMENAGLSRREAQVTMMFSQGRSAPYIGEHLFLAESTVKSHLKHAYAKLGVHNRQELLDRLQSL